MSQEWTPPGRPQAFTIPVFGAAQQADLVAIFQAALTDCVNSHGDTITGDFVITGFVDVTSMKYGGVTSQPVVICTSSTHPGTPASYPLIYETDTHQFLGYNGSGYAAIAGSGSGPNWSTTFLMMGA